MLKTLRSLLSNLLLTPEPRDNEVLFDVRTPGNLQRLGSRDLASFPPAAFRGCTGPSRVCQFENVCISRYDGVLLVNSSTARAIEHQYRSSVPALSTPMKIRLLPADTFRTLQRVHLVHGHAFAVSCWRKTFEGAMSKKSISLHDGTRKALRRGH